MSPRAKVLNVAALLAASSVVAAAIPERVEVDTGLLAGTTGASADVRLFKGIPFAAPPVAENRWKGPQPAERWEGVRAADTFGPRCMQGGPGAANPPPTSEDCLYLNVWTTADSAEDARPVMVWIYGGGP